MEANKRWLSIPKEIRSQLINNLFCTNCSGVTTIENFTIEDASFGVVLKGKCKECGHGVARVIESE
ncbi:hypothetical protein IHV12_19275 [Fictibacillus sp. 7GRE50]|uniref:hypothetical protein n=1 Tax=unclassified Fictibacillus TaxID=2644029 RepID=UPI0018CFB927|nr:MULTISPECIES: hypothetical protein [unclassified Fictibacillus]MBH0167069.1 hypothetical protein [Fictibacillus sp. 7GRE50]MBH0174835.1 hypothetical protein [Fictibacillus sp. 23RED33]